MEPYRLTSEGNTTRMYGGDIVLDQRKQQIAHIRID